ncbi:hypothetical protein ACMFKE_07120 [Staphylococcus haemolyticus]|uniref:tubby C-terminal domain-like protein n=1 Tax=Staphylococcus haemolyticus TaxID=1283 RepID=UPI002DB67326|nr:hypothetical protein [Staphylococcus haemolyticus]MEB5761481.1 hypothetical protein [Staphylococcus haemolyticus]
MYTHKIGHVLSPKLKNIVDVDDPNKQLGTIKRFEIHGFEYLFIEDMRIFFKARWRIFDNEQRLVFKGRRKFPFITKNYIVNYFESEPQVTHDITIHQKLFPEKTDYPYFYFNDECYTLRYDFFEWSTIVNEDTGSTIASWKLIREPNKQVYFELLDPTMAQHQLLFLGIFNTIFEY